MTSPIRLGVVLWSQASDWPGFLAAAQRAESLGLRHVWTWDHLLAIFGDTDQPILEGYVALGALAQATSRVRARACWWAPTRSATRASWPRAC